MKALKAKYGVKCPVCQKRRPMADPSILLPEGRCRVDGHMDLRARLTTEEWNQA